MKITSAALIALMFICSVSFGENIWDLQAIDAQGQGTHPKVGADATNSSNKVTVQGIALNSSAEYLDPNLMWQVYVQAESPDQGALAAWAGVFYNSDWPRYPTNIEPGDRVQIEGFIADHRGKVNINERHSADPSLQFTVTILDENVGMPEPQTITDLSTCNYFDETRTDGAEKYQGQWVKLSKVHFTSGTWGAGESLLVEDDGGSTMTVLLSGQGDFDEHTQPSGDLDIVGVFDQEDTDLPFHDGYRVWVKRDEHITEWTGVEDWEIYDFRQ